MIKTGDRITIYHDPLTMREREGRAQVLEANEVRELTYEETRYREWQLVVGFDSDPGGRYQRRYFEPVEMA